MVENFFKLDQSRHGVSHEHLESEAKKFFAINCLGKKLAFYTEISNYFE